jgi:hypothetical protein
MFRGGAEKPLQGCNRLLWLYVFVGLGAAFGVVRGAKRMPVIRTEGEEPWRAVDALNELLSKLKRVCYTRIGLETHRFELGRV